MNKVVETLVHVRQYDDEWPPTDLRAFSEWIKIHLEEIPPDDVESASITIDAEDHAAEITIEYERLETEAEVVARTNSRRANLLEVERRERRTLKELYEKYGAPK